MTTIIVKNQSEFKNLVELKDFRISKAIVEAILKNLYTFNYYLQIENLSIQYLIICFFSQSQILYIFY